MGQTAANPLCSSWQQQLMSYSRATFVRHDSNLGVDRDQMMGRGCRSAMIVERQPLSITFGIDTKPVIDTKPNRWMGNSSSSGGWWLLMSSTNCLPTHRQSRGLTFSGISKPLVKRSLCVGTNLVIKAGILASSLHMTQPQCSTQSDGWKTTMLILRCISSLARCARNGGLSKRTRKLRND